MAEAEKLLLEMGGKGRRYFHEFVKFKRPNTEVAAQEFADNFDLYLESRPKNKKGTRTISTFSYRNFLIGISFN